jgi:glycosyltransferase involved in cell wall biosynthesis
MITISLCMIVKNEENCLENCLQSISDIVDEIIVVDTGSTDNTVDIIRKYTDKIYSFKWVNDFSAARNYSFSLATKEYILWLDADDVFLEVDRIKLLDLKNKLDKSIDFVGMMYDYSFDENGVCNYSFRRNRLVKNSRGFYWDCFMHERLNVWGNHKDYDIHVTHTRKHDNTERNIENFRKKMLENYYLNPRETYYYGGELYAGGYYDDAIRVLEDFLSKDYDDDYDKVNALNRLASCYSIKEDYNKSIECCLKTFSYGAPKAEICYKLASNFEHLKKYNEAIFWFKATLESESPNSDLMEVDDNWINYLPHQQLCCCYYEIGDIENSMKHNELAAKYIPDDIYVIQNRELFKKLGFKKEDIK